MNGESPRPFKRRTILIKHSLQLKYISMVFMSVLLAALIVGGDIYYTLARIILMDNPSLFPIMSRFNTMILVKILLYLTLILMISLYISHRFAGPIYRFEKSAQTISQGDLTHRVSLRSGDELAELQEEFNGMIASLQALVQRDRELAFRLAQRLGAAIKKLPEEGDIFPEIRKDLSHLKTELGNLTKSFKV